MRRARSMPAADAAALVALVADRDRVDIELRGRIGQLRRLEVSWAEIGEAVGLTPQGAQQRYAASSPRARNR